MVDDFFNFYNHEFDYDKHVVSLSRPGTTLRTLRQTGPNTYEMGPCH